MHMLTHMHTGMHMQTHESAAERAATGNAHASSHLPPQPQAGSCAAALLWQLLGWPFPLLAINRATQAVALAAGQASLAATEPPYVLPGCQPARSDSIEHLSECQESCKPPRAALHQELRPRGASSQEPTCIQLNAACIQQLTKGRSALRLGLCRLFPAPTPGTGFAARGPAEVLNIRWPSIDAP